MRLSKIAAAAVVMLAGLMPMRTDAKVYGDTLFVPERAVILTGDKDAGAGNIAVLYSREGLSFDDPSAPRFLFLDREGKVALGIGGYVKGIAMYDFDGAVDQTGFVTYDIPAPMNPAQRQRFGADASHSTLFLKLVANSRKLGKITVYVQTGFTGGTNGYGLKLKQAYVNVGHLTAGLARSSFADGEAQAPTIDPQGPSGEVDAKNMTVQYKTNSYKGWSGAISIEVPNADYTTVTDVSEAIAQRFPDIPLYVQYAWNSESHIRISGILRELSYRDMVTSSNHLVTGWGVHLSGVGDIAGGLGFFGHFVYGKGIASYLNDIAGAGYDLVPTGTSGELQAPGMMGWTAGLSYNFTKRFFMTANYSLARVYDCEALGGDSYRSGQYATVNAFYNLTSDFRLGAEYVYGKRTNIDGVTGHANRIETMLQYSF